MSNEGNAYERRQSVADAAYSAQAGVALITQRLDNHERICGERYLALQGWLKSTFFMLLTALGVVIFWLITEGHK